MSVPAAGRVAVLTLFALTAAACSPKPPSCNEPIMPATVDGSNAVESQMTKAHDEVVRFQKQSDAYQTCLVGAINDHHNNPPLLSRLHDDGFETDLENRKHKNQMDKERVVGEFNASVRLYNEIHP